MFFSIFGGAWLVFWGLETYGMRLGFLSFVVAGSTVLFLVSLRQFKKNKSARATEADSPARKRAGRIFNIVNAVQWILIFVVANALSKLGHDDWIIPSIILIVGLHFLPLAAAFK